MEKYNSKPILVSTRFHAVKQFWEAQQDHSDVPWTWEYTTWVSSVDRWHLFPPSMSIMVGSAFWRPSLRMCTRLKMLRWDMLALGQWIFEWEQPKPSWEMPWAICSGVRAGRALGHTPVNLRLCDEDAAGKTAGVCASCCLPAHLTELSLLQEVLINPQREKSSLSAVFARYKKRPSAHWEAAVRH